MGGGMLNGDLIGAFRYAMMMRPFGVCEDGSRSGVNDNRRIV
jgi:hypothetical protein